MAAIKRYIDKFKKHVVIDDTHPLAIAQDALDAKKAPPKEKGEEKEEAK